MGRLWQSLRYLSVPIGVLAIQACSGLGYQGGLIPTTFTGINSAYPVSPQTVQLNWTAYPGAYKYNVYTPAQNDAIYTPGFNQILFKPVPNDPTVTYQYSVTAIDPTTGNEQGERSAYTNVKLLPHFNFATSGSITPASKTSMLVKWAGNQSVSYMVYIGERLPTGVVNYNNFISSAITVSNSSQALVSGLLEGHEYCAIVVAAYSDQSNDLPPLNGVSSLYTGDVGSALNSSTYMVGGSGAFGDSAISQAEKCDRTQSDFSVASLKIYTQKAALSNQPIFYVNVPGDTTEDTNGTVSTAIYQVNDTTGISTLIGTRIGTGRITAQTAIPSGRYHFFANVSDLSSTAQAQVEINVGPTGATPTGDANRSWVYVRSFNATETTATSTGYYPEKQQGGFGSQNEGSSVAVGDFNCDGKKDVAIGIPNASVMASDNRPAKSGKVIIYYDTTVAGSTPGSVINTTKSKVITFDITSFAPAGRDLQLGTSLYVGNFNGDTQATNQYGGSGLSSTFQCDDLAIGSGYGPLFVLYGKRDVVTGGGDGGLNWTSPTAYTLNPSTSCDPASNTCQVAVYTQGSNYSLPIGKKMTSGDYNGDGYEDLAVTTSLASGPGGVWVFRGSEYGLIAPTSGNGLTGEQIGNSGGGPYPSFPFISVSKAFFAPSPTPSAGWGDGGFGSSISTFHNAYYDEDSTKVKGSKRIRDVLLIGDPANGAYTSVTTTSNTVHACIPKSNMSLTSWGTIGSTSNDVNTGLYWDCSGNIPAPMESSNGPLSAFGYAMSDIKNPLRYRPDQFTETNCSSNNCFQNNVSVSKCSEGYGNCSTTSTYLGYPGGVAISSVTLSYGRVYVYYGVNTPHPYALTSTTTTTDRDTMGWDRNLYLTGLMNYTRYDQTTTLGVTSGSACVTAGAVSPSTSYEYCNIQEIFLPNGNSSEFGAVLGTVPGNITETVDQAKDSILAVADPFVTETLSDGTQYSGVGAVQLYLQNSQFANNPIIVRPSAAYNPANPANTSTNNPCSNDGICRYADGFSNTLTTSLDYDGTLANNVNFGLGGIVGGPLSEGDTAYNSNSDIIIGTPGHVAHPAVTGNPNVVDNGAALAFFSAGGTYRTYETTDTTSNPSPWHVMDVSFSQESDMKFHQAISLGDIDQDGIGDVGVRINQGSRNTVRIYRGSSSKVGFSTDPTSYTNISIQGDATAGIRMVPLGAISTLTSNAYMMVGAQASYILFDGVGGLIQGFPNVLGTSQAPRKMSAFYAATHDANFTTTNSGGIGYLGFGDGSFWNAETSGNLTSTFNSYANFAYGDFNGDGYMDVAIGYRSGYSIADEARNKGCGSSGPAAASNYCAGDSNGSVMIFYGGAENGFQIQPDGNGGYPVGSNFFTDYSATMTSPVHTYFGAPCSTSGTGCKIQMLHEATTGNGIDYYGNVITSVPAGYCSTAGGLQHKVSALVVNSVINGVPSVFTYRPRCLDTNFASDYSGLVSYNADGSGLPATLTLPTQTNSAVITSMTSVTGLMGTTPALPANGDILSHLVIADQANSSVLVYPVRTINSTTKASFEVPSGPTTFASTTTFTNDGGRLINYASSAMNAGLSGATIGFGSGVSSIGDVNGDGYSDIGVSISELARKDTSTQVADQGAVMLIFGGAAGPQSHTSSTYTTTTEPSRTATCYIAPSASVPTSICNPQLLYAPQPTNSLRNGAYEYSYLSPYSYVPTQSVNESLGTFIFGIPGRDTLDDAPVGQAYGSTRILEAGAFYVLP